MLTKKQLKLFDDYVTGKQEEYRDETENLNLFKIETAIQVAVEIKDMLMEGEENVIFPNPLTDHKFIRSMFPKYQNYGLGEELVLIVAMICDKNIPKEITGVSISDMKIYLQHLKNNDFPFDVAKQILDYFENISKFIRVRDRRRIFKKVDFPVMVILIYRYCKSGYKNYHQVSRMFLDFFINPSNEYLELRRTETRTKSNIKERYKILLKFANEYK
jgi:hypothetical protein